MRHWRKLVTGLVVAAVLAVGVYFFVQYQHAQALLKDPTLAAKEEITNLVAAVGKLMELPVGETPTVATVSDKDKLKDQAFFAHAQTGDKVLIYSNARKAILYRPSTNKIIEVAPLNITANQTAPLAARVAIYNGSVVAGAATTAETKLKSQFPSLTVVAKENAKKYYDTTVVVDLTAGRMKDQAAAIASFLGASMTSNLGQEASPSADIVVILGQK